MSNSDYSAGGYRLVLSFDGLYPTMAEEHAFCHGVEFAGLWQRMRAGQEAEIEATTHRANRTIIERAAAKEGWQVEFIPTPPEVSDDWDVAVLRKVRSERDNPHGLRVVTGSAL